MIVGNGIDIVEVERIKSLFKRFGYRFIEKIYTAGEIEYCYGHSDPFPHLAGRFAAKEAVAKSLGAKPEYHFKRIEILNHSDGMPHVRLSGPAKETFANLEADLVLSISHTNNYGVASCLLNSWD